MLPWFRSEQIPLYLAPMAGVTDSVFRRLCKEHGADVVVTEFVSADGILHRNQRTHEMVTFRPEERPIGVQLFGADPEKMADAARAVVDWVQPDFIDLNFGCPVNKVVCRHGAQPTSEIHYDPQHSRRCCSAARGPEYAGACRARAHALV